MIAYGDGFKPWLEAKLGTTCAPGTTFIGRIKDGQPVVAVGFCNYRYGDDIELSVAAEPGSGTAGLLGCIWAYVFEQLGCSRCTAHIRDDNAASIRLAKRLKFKHEGTLRKARDGHDVHIYGLIREDLCLALRNRRSQ